MQAIAGTINIVLKKVDGQAAARRAPAANRTPHDSHNLNAGRHLGRQGRQAVLLPERHACSAAAAVTVERRRRDRFTLPDGELTQLRTTRYERRRRYRGIMSCSRAWPGRSTTATS